MSRMLDPVPLNGDNIVLPPYSSTTDPISLLSTGTYNASQYASAWTDPPGTVLSCSGQLMRGGKKDTRRTVRKRSRKTIRYKKIGGKKNKSKRNKTRIKVR